MKACVGLLLCAAQQLAAARCQIITRLIEYFPESSLFMHD
jgi:hypothetical protein